MRIPTLRGLIDRRVLVNYRVDPSILSTLLPSPFRPQIVSGFAIAGICLIRLKHVRPRFVPSIFGISSENAAHRIAVEWDVADETRTGVFIPRRDTSSRFVAFAGGRLFPGEHHHSRFDVKETEDHFHIEMQSQTDFAHVSVDANTIDHLAVDSIFSTVDEASQFFQAGSLGYSPQKATENFDGLELRTFNWSVKPLAVTHVTSSFFDARTVFPEGAVTFDNALLMQGIDHEWHGRECPGCDG